MPKQGPRTTRTSSHATTSAPTAKHFAFARNYWLKGSASAAGRATWPDLKAAEAKGIKWFARDDVKLAVEAVREAAQDRIRAEYLQESCGLTDIIKLISVRLKDSETPAREFRELAIYALDMQGNSPKKTKERPASGNALAQLVAQSAGLGAALGASLPDPRLPIVRTVFPENQEQAGPVGSDGAVAAPGHVVGTPQVADSKRTGRVAADIEVPPGRV